MIGLGIISNFQSITIPSHQHGRIEKQAGGDGPIKQGEDAASTRRYRGYQSEMTRVCRKEKTGIERQQLRLGSITASCRVLFVGSGLHWGFIRLEGKERCQYMGTSVMWACLLRTRKFLVDSILVVVVLLKPSRIHPSAPSAWATT